MTAERNAPVWLTALLVLVGIVLIVVGIVYFAEPARHLPGFFPGHERASLHHTKHGIAAIVVAVVVFAVAWISSGRRRST
jgi:drug/metabolite transporter (DMT)-like permease